MRDYNKILSDMMARVTNDVDKREGSVVHTALAPVAAELVQYEIQHEYDLRDTFLGTATGKALDNRASDFGYKREMAKPATVKATIIGTPIPNGARWASVGTESVNYVVTADTGGNTYTMVAEEISSIANTYTGTILPLDAINGITSAEINQVIIPQLLEEDDERFRKRIQSGIYGGATDGNIAQYEKWANTFDGIGKFKVFSLWNGLNTVKVSVLDELELPASVELIKLFQDYLDPGTTGLGNGQAPIGAKVTVSTATAIPINVSFTATYVAGYSAPAKLKEALTEFFASVAYSKTTVNYLSVATVVTSNVAIESVSNLTINGANVDITLENEEVPKIGTVTANGVIL